MVQAVDGNWYGYFADRNMAQIADSTATVVGSGLDFGNFCAASSGTLALGFSTSETSGISLPISAKVTTGVTTNGTQTGSSAGGVITNTCVALTVGGSTANGTTNVVREAKDVNPAKAGVLRGQIGLLAGDGVWPFIQLYTLSAGGNVVVQYNKGGGVQSTTLTFDTVDEFASTALDRTVYPNGAQIHATITDLWLNIDPTDEDSWTFSTNSIGNVTNVDSFYQVFNENGGSGGSALSTKSKLSTLMCEDNCILKINANVQSALKPVSHYTGQR